MLECGILLQLFLVSLISFSSTTHTLEAIHCPVPVITFICIGTPGYMLMVHKPMRLA